MKRQKLIFFFFLFSVLIFSSFSSLALAIWKHIMFTLCNVYGGVNAASTIQSIGEDIGSSNPHIMLFKAHCKQFVVECVGKIQKRFNNPQELDFLQCLDPKVAFNLTIPGADPGFSFGGGGGKKWYARMSAKLEVLYGRGPGPTYGPWKLSGFLILSRAIWAIFLSILIQNAGVWEHLWGKVWHNLKCLKRCAFQCIKSLKRGFREEQKSLKSD